MTTSVGRFLRKLRIDKGEILRDMADKLGVSSAFLSAVENGKKKMPDAWISKLQEVYSLSPIQVSELKDAAVESSGIVEMRIADTSDETRKLVISFARRFEELDDETVKKLRCILEKHKEN